MIKEAENILQPILSFFSITNFLVSREVSPGKNVSCRKVVQGLDFNEQMPRKDISAMKVAKLLSEMMDDNPPWTPAPIERVLVTTTWVANLASGHCTSLCRARLPAIPTASPAPLFINQKQDYTDQEAAGGRKRC